MELGGDPPWTPLTGQWAVVTGASKGIGQGTARGLPPAGATSSRLAPLPSPPPATRPRRACPRSGHRLLAAEMPHQQARRRA